MPLDVHIARNLQEMPGTTAQWNRLVQLDPDGSVFQTREWIETWWETFGLRDRLLMISVSEGDRLVGLMPLMRGVHGPEDEVRFVGHGHADYMDVISAPGDRRRVIGAALDALAGEPDWAVLRLCNVPGGSPTAAALDRTCRAHGLRVLRDDDEICPTLVRDMPDRNHATLAKKYRVRRASNALRRMGALEVQDLTDRETARAHLDAFFDLHIRRWESTSTPSMFLDPANRRFYEGLTERMLPTGHLLFSMATLDQRPIAFHFGFDFGGRVLWYKPAFEPELARHSPGTVIIEHLLNHVRRHKRQELDFTIGAEPFKQRYANAERININLRIYRKTSRYLASWTFDRGYRALRWTVRRLGLAPAIRRYLRP